MHHLEMATADGRQMTDEELDHTPVTKGKYSGKTMSQIAEIDPAYVIWACGEWKPMPCSKLLLRDCKKDIADSRRPRGSA
jgi:hypothetical protein